MILLVHMLFGAAVGYKTYSLTNNVWLAIFFALLSHYFLDIFPHIEYLKSVENSIKKVKFEKFNSYFGDMSKIVLDFILGIFFIFVVSKNYPAIYLYAFLAIVPDGFTVVNLFFKNPVLAIHQKFHGNIQYFTKKEKFSVFWRISTQVLAFLISVILLAS